MRLTYPSLRSITAVLLGDLPGALALPGAWGTQSPSWPPVTPHPHGMLMGFIPCPELGLMDACRTQGLGLAALERGWPGGWRIGPAVWEQQGSPVAHRQGTRCLRLQQSTIIALPVPASFWKHTSVAPAWQSSCSSPSFGPQSSHGASRSHGARCSEQGGEYRGAHHRANQYHRHW